MLSIVGQAWARGRGERKGRGNLLSVWLLQLWDVEIVHETTYLRLRPFDWGCRQGGETGFSDQEDWC
jgi:hypothetical protein